LKTKRQLQNQIHVLEYQIQILEKRLKEKQIVIDMIKDEAKNSKILGWLIKGKESV